MTTFLIGIDDTDNDTSPGTGQLARRLLAEAVGRGAQARGITRHQFLVDERIPFTSHNSGACVALDWPGTIQELEFAAALIAEWSAEGSDPGICIVASDCVPAAVTDWGWRATREVLDIDAAMTLAASHRVGLQALGGTAQGVIGALGSVGLRAGGNEGRFLDLPGLRDLGERVDLRELARIGIRVDHQLPEGAPVRDGTQNAPYLTLNWVRPRLLDGQPVWPVTWSNEHDAWIPVDQKRSRPLE